jgi:hypothetical protein
MSLTLQELIDVAVVHVLPLAGDEDLGVLAESYVYEVCQEVSEECARDANSRPLLRQTLDMTVSNGQATMPTNAFVEWLSEAEVYDPSDLTKEYSFVREVTDFRLPKSKLLGYFAVEGGSTYRQIEPGSTYDPATGFTGGMKMVVPCFIQVPASASASFSIRQELEDELVMKLELRLRNAIGQKVAA